MKKFAVLSPDLRYRYFLSRHWGAGNRILCFIMLNPSKADAEIDDTTVKLCIQWAINLGFDGLVIVNLFAFRSTDPKALKLTDAPIGEDNNQWIEEAVKRSSDVLCAWGNNGNLYGRDKEVLQILRDLSISPKCLRISKSGQPVHPLYQPYSLQPVPYGGRNCPTQQ